MHVYPEFFYGETNFNRVRLSKSFENVCVCMREHVNNWLTTMSHYVNSSVLLKCWQP